jgi:hypothetical protein
MISVRYLLMQEIVIVVPDLHLSTAPVEVPSRHSGLPGLAQTARFGSRAPLPRGWRDWLANWLGLESLARLAPASVVAAAFEPADVGQGRDAWLAMPLHLTAGLTTVHVDRRSLIRPPRAELEQLAADFGRVFRDSGQSLKPVDCGELLLFAAPVPAVRTTEPTRLPGGDLGAALPVGAGAQALRRWGAEIEMWLHEHPLNRERAQRHQPPVSTLWIWGGDRGGGPADAPIAAPGPLTAAAFGCDAWLHGLWKLAGGAAQPVPDQIAAVLGYAPAQRAVVVLELGPTLRLDAARSVLDALGELDERFVAPAVRAVRKGDLERLFVLINDQCFLFRSRDALRLWRRPRPALEALQ